MQEPQTQSLNLKDWTQTVLVAAPQLAYRIGDITFGLIGERDMRFALDPIVGEFAIKAESAEVNLRISWADRLEVPRSAPLFQSGGTWSLFDEPEGYRFSFASPLLGNAPYKEAWFDREFRSGCVRLSREYFDASQTAYPLEYPLDELLMIHRLSCGEGVEVHAVGICDERGVGHLFLGHSGAGKSTTARLWKGRPGVRILSDDRIILRAHDARIWMYGTPWHGDAGIASPECAEISKIYLLEHGKKNEQVPLCAGQAAAELFARSFVPLHSAEGLQFALSFLERVARAIPCSTFRFVPDKSAVEAIRHARE
jgi:hypothetical protein